MEPIAPVVEGHAHVVFKGEGCQDLPALVVADPGLGSTMVVTRWSPSAEDLLRLATGGSVYLFQWTGGAPLQPVALDTAPPDVEGLELTPDGVKVIVPSPRLVVDALATRTQEWVDRHAPHRAIRVADASDDAWVRLECAACREILVTSVAVLSYAAPAWRMWLSGPDTHPREPL